MPMEFIDKLKAVMRRRDVTLKDLGEKTGQSVQNLSNKMRRGNFSEEEMRKLADALDCDFDFAFKFRDTGEII